MTVVRRPGRAPSHLSIAAPPAPWEVPNALTSAPHPSTRVAETNARRRACGPSRPNQSTTSRNGSRGDAVTPSASQRERGGTRPRTAVVPRGYRAPSSLRASAHALVPTGSPIRRKISRPRLSARRASSRRCGSPASSTASEYGRLRTAGMCPAAWNAGWSPAAIGLCEWLPH